MAEGGAYPLRIEHPYRCPLSGKVGGLACREVRAQDLAAWYDTASVEVGVDGFVADVLLTSDRARPLLVEIEVTHGCEPEKIAAGLRIVEVRVRDEDDVATLLDGIDTTAPNVSIHGLRPKPRSGPCQGTCFDRARTFILFRSGKTWMGMKTLVEIRQQSRVGAVAHMEVVDGDWTERDVTIFDIDPHVQRASFDLGKDVRSCLLCRHHAFSAGRRGGQLPIRCLEGRGNVGHNIAADCPGFRRLSRPELAERRHQIAERTDRSGSEWILDTMLPSRRP